MASRPWAERWENPRRTGNDSEAWSHLHHFKVGEQLYGDPDLVQENFEDMGYKDSTTTNISDILPEGGRRFRFVYEYDFGDSWDHEVLFEGVVRADPRVTYPLCPEGERACPPEDVGGVWGYADFLEAIQNPATSGTRSYSDGSGAALTRRRSTRRRRRGT
jgi:hypothetical protein